MSHAEPRPLGGPDLGLRPARPGSAAAPPPQPIGAFPLPAGLLLVPSVETAELAPAVDALRAGRLPDIWPAVLRAHQLAHVGDPVAAHAAIADGDAFAAYNRFVLDPESVDPESARRSLPPELAPLVDLIQYTNAEVGEPPEPGDGAAPEVAALVLAAQASCALDHGRADEAVVLLERAADRAAGSPPLAAILAANAATILREHGGARDDARARLAAAAAALADTDLLVSRAEIELALGMIEHELVAATGGPLQGAMHHYYTALQLIRREDSPYLWASAQMNLAAAHLAAPMVQASEALRLGIAIQALRAALEVFTPQAYPNEWATATLNLANSLVYTPSTKQGDNLVEAVELYEAVLAVRDRDTDPLGRARVLANQGNALAHLGVFDQAKAKLYEARFLFEEQLDHESVMAVRSVLDEIAKQVVPRTEGATSQAPISG